MESLRERVRRDAGVFAHGEKENMGVPTFGL
jgi:hypothetical protein